MPCYLTKESYLRHNGENYKLLVTHYLTKGLHELHYCSYCSRNLTLNLSANQCNICTENYAQITTLIYNLNIDFRYVNFIYDVLNGQLHYMPIT